MANRPSSRLGKPITAIRQGRSSIAELAVGGFVLALAVNIASTALASRLDTSLLWITASVLIAVTGGYSTSSVDFYGRGQSCFKSTVSRPRQDGCPRSTGSPILQVHRESPRDSSSRLISRIPL